MLKLFLFLSFGGLFLVQSAPMAASLSQETKEKMVSLRDYVNGEESDSFVVKKKTKKYKCFLVEDEDEEPTPSVKKVAKHPQANPKKFVYTDDEESAAVPPPPPPPPKPVPIPATLPPPPPPPSPAPKIQETQSSSFKQMELETISEDEAAVVMPPIHPHQMKLVSIPAPSAAPAIRRPQLKQVHLPKAHPSMAEAPTTIPPEIATAKRDKQNRPLILSPEHCNQIKHYAEMYGVSDAKSWVHNNCSFAKVYLPTATCEEIDILVASCYRNN